MIWFRNAGGRKRPDAKPTGGLSERWKIDINEAGINVVGS